MDLSLDLNILFNGLITLLLLGQAWWFKQWKAEMERRIIKVEAEAITTTQHHDADMKEMKQNYLDRFAELRELQHKNKDEIITVLHNLENKIDIQNEKCSLIQDQKKNK